MSSCKIGICMGEDWFDTYCDLSRLDMICKCLWLIFYVAQQLKLSLDPGSCMSYILRLYLLGILSLRLTVKAKLRFRLLYSL